MIVVSGTVTGKPDGDSHAARDGHLTGTSRLALA